MNKARLWYLLAIAFSLLLLTLPPDPSAKAEVTVVLAEGTEYKAFFVRGDQIQQLMGDLLDLTDEGMLSKLGGASGGVISDDRHHATLRPGEKVYAVVKVLKDVRIERMRAILETQVIQNPRGLSLAAALKQNFFKVKYIDFAASGGQVSYADAYIRETSTQERPFMIITPSGDRLFYFSYQSSGGTAGIRTKITYRFTTGPAIMDVAPRMLFTSCRDIKNYLIDVPEPTGNPCADWAYYNSKCYEQDVRNRLKCAILCNTEPYVNIPGNPHTDEKTIKLRVDGFAPAELDAIVAGRDVRIGAMGVTTVNSVAVQRIANPTSGMHEAWLEIKFTVNQGVHGCQAVVVGEHTLESPVVSPIPETFLKLISDAPDMYVGQKVFVGLRIVGTTESMTLSLKTSGQIIQFPDMAYQRFDVGRTQYASGTDLCISFPGGCANIGSAVDTAIDNGDETIITEPCSFQQTGKEPKVNLIVYRPQTEYYGKPFQRTAVPDDEEEKPGAGIRKNGDDDNGNKRSDFEDGRTPTENDLIEVRLEVEPRMAGAGIEYVVRRSNANIKIWEKKEKGATPYVPSDLNSLERERETFIPPLEMWVEWVNMKAGEEESYLEVELRRVADKSVIKSDKIRFFPFRSVIVALGGLKQKPTDPPDPNHGTFNVAIDLYRQGYDVHMYVEGSVSDEGEGIPYEEILQAYQRRGVTSFAIYGYSRGGGATYDLANALYNNYRHVATMTGYIDAIMSGTVETGSERRRPPGTSFHLNYYQRHSGGVLGLYGDSLQNPQAGDVQVNVTTEGWEDTNGNLLDHFTIDDDSHVRTGIIDRIKEHLPNR